MYRAVSAGLLSLGTPAQTPSLALAVVIVFGVLCFVVGMLAIAATMRSSQLSREEELEIDAEIANQMAATEKPQITLEPDPIESYPASYAQVGMITSPLNLSGHQPPPVLHAPTVAIIAQGPQGAMLVPLNPLGESEAQTRVLS